MPKPYQRTKSRKRCHTALPRGGKTQIHYRKEVLSAHSGFHYVQPLAEILHLSTSEELRTLNRGKKGFGVPTADSYVTTA